jgi:capsular exopolysaccharide synthesis family protein
MLINDNNTKKFDYINEKYKILRTNIMHLDGMDKVKVVLITDIDGEIEKEKVIGNLGSVFSKLKDKRILIVDANFRDAKMHEFFNLGNNFGLYNAICNPTNFLRTIQTITEGRFYFQATGPVPLNTSELLCTDEMKRVMHYMRNSFDLTIFNAPPICGNADSQVMASLVDGTILLVKVGTTKSKKIKEARLMLERVNANILGAISVN